MPAEDASRGCGRIEDDLLCRERVWFREGVPVLERECDIWSVYDLWHGVTRGQEEGKC